MQEQKQKPGARQVRIEISDEVADGIYSNMAFIAHNNSEFILDFARYMPGSSKGKVASRVVMGPVHAKALLKSLADAVERFEKSFGAITPDGIDKNVGFTFSAGSEKGEC